MVKQRVTKVKMTHKDGEPRKRLVRTRASANGKKIDLHKLAARRTLVVRR